jgi:riboflavin biosynthesis pyrimidine reductase
VILRRVLPQADVTVDLDEADARAQVAELYRPPRAEWFRLNLIGTISGAATGPDGTSESITNPVDRVILNVIRSLADVVLIGAASVRKEGYFVPRRAALAVVTRSGDLAGHRITSGADRGPLLVLCPKAAAALAAETVGDSDARILTLPDSDGYLASAEIVMALRGAGYASIVAEGGPDLAARLARDGVADELCLTTSPQLSIADVPLFGPLGETPIPLTLSQLLVDDGGATYARWSCPGGH